MSGFYKMEPLKWDRGTDDLTLEQEAAYLRIVNAINAADQAIRENYRMLAGMWRCNERRAKRLLAELVEAGKVTVENGWIINRKAMEDVSMRRELSVKRSSSGHSGGIESGKSRSKTLKTKETDEANASSRIEENRRDKKEERAKALLCVRRFQEFWDTFPHRGGTKRNRSGSEKKYREAVKRGVLEQTIIDGAKAAHADPTVRKGFARDPATWLHQEGWSDQIDPQQPHLRAVDLSQDTRPDRPNRILSSEERLAAMRATWKEA